MSIKKEGTYAIVLLHLSTGRIGKDEAKGALGRLVRSGWRCDVSLYAQILEETDRF